MTVALTGDFAKLGVLERQLKRLKRDGQRRVTAQLAAETKELVLKCFDESRAPDGTPWAPLKYRVGKPLEDTRRLKNSISARVTGDSKFRVFTRVVYAAVHNFGHRFKERIHRRSRSGRFHSRGRFGSVFGMGIPKRQFLPAGGTLPDRWARRLRDLAAATVVSFFR